MRGGNAQSRESDRRSQSQRWRCTTLRRTKWARGGVVGQAMMRSDFAFSRLAFTSLESFRNSKFMASAAKAAAKLRLSRHGTAEAVPRRKSTLSTHSEATAYKTFRVLRLSSVPFQDLGRLPMPLARSEMELLTNSKWPRL